MLGRGDTIFETVRIATSPNFCPSHGLIYEQRDPGSAF
jgi:hypothetical protein